MAKNFSDKYLASLKPKNKVYQVREAQGFALRVLPTGTKTFLFIYEVCGKRKQLNMGIYPQVSLAEAREKYNYAVKALSAGRTLTVPPETVTRTVTLVKDVIDAYLLSCEGQNTYWKACKDSILNKKLKDWHLLPVTSITKQQAIAFIENDKKNGKAAAVNSYKVLHALFEYAVNMEYLEVSPVTRIKKAVRALNPEERSRFLREDEITTVWRGIETAVGTAVTKRALKLVLVTGQRPGEVCGMSSTEISGDWWVIPKERAMKGNRDHRVFLTDLAKELIGEGNGFIFPSPKKPKQSLYRGTMAKLLCDSNFFGLPRFTPHDLRRTVRTHLSRLKVPREHAEAVVNHAKQGMVKIYDQYEFDDEKKEAMLKWEAELLRLLGGVL